MLPDWVAHQAAAAPQHPALVADGRTWTWQELDAGVTRMARWLGAHGVMPGDRIATLLRNGAAPAIVVHALLRLRAILVPLNTRLTPAEIAPLVADTAPRLMLVDRHTLPLASRVCLIASDGAVALLDVAGGLDVKADASPSALSLSHDPAAVLAIIYTSGTTGTPKGAMLTVGNFWWSAIGSALNLGTHADDRWLACLPLFHVGGLSIVLRAAIYGITAVVHDAFDADEVNRAIDEDGLTIVSVVAVMLQRMLDARDGLPYPASLRTVLVGGGPVPHALLEHCATLGVPVVQTYGLTETASQVATLAPRDALRKPGSAGRPLYPNEIRILGDGGDVSAQDEAGEILVRGPIVMAGYTGAADVTRSAIVDGWLHTGDIGYLDAEGHLHVLDRRDDLIITGGENVYPAEVEAVLLASPGVAEAGVIGVHDPEWGQRVVAVIVPDASGRIEVGVPSADALRAHCRERLAAYKVPREIRFSDAPLPRTASGKLQRGRLSAREAPPT